MQEGRQERQDDKVVGRGHCSRAFSLNFPFRSRSDFVVVDRLKVARKTKTKTRLLASTITQFRGPLGNASSKFNF